ncbi:hypothetical protein [Polynucleobacter corsicus]|uniref:hypothetical protein n=1 Tax=Polynucleobacter corsicus TaxID=2081042 RepID=UPI001BFD12E7|nr:hypothetical protein [Polynucleobacter corsicus]QWE18820.1 hypothetical protein C2747_00780 [Polynucleobacter corsicus]
MDKILREWMVGFIVSVFAYSSLFCINAWLTTHLSYSLGVNWIYLPAGLRLFLTLIFGLSGAVGIAIASFVICFFGPFPFELTTYIGIGLISGFAPYLAKLFVASNISISSDLSNLSVQKLAICVVIYAALSSGLHQWWFAVRGIDEAGTLNHFLVMVIGDVLGAVILIGLVKYGLDLMKPSKSN